MIGIIFATSEEARHFLDASGDRRVDDISEGAPRAFGDVLVLATGIGKIKATLQTERFLTQNDVDRIVHVGTCSALTDEMEIGALLGASFVLEGDRVELSAPSYPRMPLTVPDGTDVSGTLVTQDHAVDGEDRSYWQRLADVNDTTGYAVAYVAAQHGIPCHVVKVITGRVGEDNESFLDDRQEAFDTLRTFLDAFVEQHENG